MNHRISVPATKISLTVLDDSVVFVPGLLTRTLGGPPISKWLDKCRVSGASEG